MLRAYGVTDRGHVRPINEDCFAIADAAQLCVVADGMGGHNAGEVASKIAVDAIVEHIERFRDKDEWLFGYDPNASHAGNLLWTAVHVANGKVFDLATATPDYSGMGTTIVAILVHEGRLSVAHAGDSRAYLLNEGALKQLTEDDTWVASVLARDPHTDPTLLRLHPMRHALTNVVGSRPRTSVHLSERLLRAGDRLVMTTDGVHGVLDDARLAQLVEGQDDAGKAAAQLVEAALASGSRDNCTALIADYDAG
jgi:serine/threonine protein phosphatase PrpC